MDLDGRQNDSIESLLFVADKPFKEHGKQSRYLPSFRVLFLLFNLLIIVLNIVFSSLTWSKISRIQGYCPEPPYSPATPDLRYYERVLDPYAPSIYGGNVSSPETIAAWKSLKLNELYRATKKELELSGSWREDALRMENGGYMAMYRVAHEIHCLDWIKLDWTVHRETKPELREHLDHCLRSLREGAMCRPDLTIGSYYWWPADKNQRHKRPDAPRQCLAYDSLEEHMAKRRIDMSDGVIEKPLDYDGKPIVVPPDDHTKKL